MPNRFRGRNSLQQPKISTFSPRCHPIFCAFMVVEFTKMNGAGNDFVLLDNRRETLRLTKEQVVSLCDRHRGVGADGLILLRPASAGADWAWDFYNNDGSQGEMCG